MEANRLKNMENWKKIMKKDTYHFSQLEDGRNNFVRKKRTNFQKKIRIRKKKKQTNNTPTIEHFFKNIFEHTVWWNLNSKKIQSELQKWKNRITKII